MYSLSKRAVLTAVLALALAACGDRKAAGTAPGAAPAPAAGVLNVYNWSDYIDPQVLLDFERETGIKVRYDVFDSNEVLVRKCQRGCDAAAGRRFA
jgi:spermidine/putrescine-binding protein